MSCASNFLPFYRKNWAHLDVIKFVASGQNFETILYVREVVTHFIYSVTTYNWSLLLRHTVEAFPIGAQA